MQAGRGDTKDKAKYTALSLTNIALRWFPAGLTHLTAIVTDTCIRETVAAIRVCTQEKVNVQVYSLVSSPKRRPPDFTQLQKERHQILLL